ncbi:MAG: hypothetical protein IJ573_03910 [Clostridia bacterium]|nr:hypothetical protein [Clostridia bacterium]
MKHLMKGLAWALCFMLALPAFSLAQEGNYEAGQMTATVASDSYRYGQQINVDLTYETTEAAAEVSKRVAAAAALLEQCELSMSFYDDYGTAQIHGVFSLDGVELLDVTVLLPQDGSLQMQTNLTGNSTLTLPAGALTRGGSLQDMFYGSIVRRKTDVSLTEMTATERLKATSSDVLILVFNHLLGWTSYQQMEREETLYVFDDTHFDATETRDAVEQRMIGTVYASEFTELLWNITATIDAEMGDFQQALADVLAERGVTRLQVRHLVDQLFTKETIDPATDYVQPTHAIPDDGALCTYNDISYFFKKLVKCTDSMWENCTEETLSLIVSYDENGRMVGFDAVLPKFTQDLPYEGNYSWSLVHDENGQEKQTIHGELELFNDNRLMGDAVLVLGKDIEGVCESSVQGHLDLVNRADGQQTSTGLGVAGSLTSTLTQDGTTEGEAVEGALVLSLRQNGEENDALSVTLDSQTKTEDGVTFTLDADIGIEAAGLLPVRTNLNITTSDPEELNFAGGQAIDLTNLSEENIETLISTVKKQGAALLPQMMLHPSVLSNLTRLVSD